MTVVNAVPGAVPLANWGIPMQNKIQGTPGTDPHVNFAQVFNVKNAPYGAVGDGVTDDSVAIRNAAAAVPAAGGTLYFPWGTYLVDFAPATFDAAKRSIIELKNNTRMVLDGVLKLKNNAGSVAGANNFIVTTKEWSTGTSPVGKNISIYGNGVGEIDGNKANNPVGLVYGIQFGGGTQYRVEGMYIHDTSETGIAFEYLIKKARGLFNRIENGGQDGLGNNFGSGASFSQDIWYVGNYVSGCVANGVLAEGGKNIHVLENTLFGNQNAGVAVGNGPGDLYGADVIGNECLSNTGRGIVLGIAGYDAHEVRLVGNHVFDNVNHGIEIGTRGARFLVVGNVVRDNARDGGSFSGIVCLGIEGTIVGNTCTDTRAGASKTQEYGIATLVGADNVLIEGNMVQGNELGTILLQGGTNLKVMANHGFNPQGVAAITVGASPQTITAGATPEAIYIQGGTFTSIVKNAITVFSGAATQQTIWLEPAESCVLTWTVAPTILSRDRK